MARGGKAKIEVAEKLAKAFGEDYIGEVDKKWYVWANDGGERVQIAIAMTCPKVFVDAEDKNPVEKKEDFDWSSDTVVTKPEPKEKVEITEAEKQKIADIMERLGL